MPSRHPILRVVPAVRRGSAMTETVLVLPFLLLVLMLLFYFGRDAARVQHAQELARYETWRAATAAGIPAPAADPDRDNPQLKSMFFGGANVTVAGQTLASFPDNVMDQWRADLTDAAAGQLFDDFRSHVDTGKKADFFATATDSVPVWQQFNGPIHQSHVRLGHNWMYVDGWRKDDKQGWMHDKAGLAPAWMLNPAAQDVFFQDVEGPLADLANQGNVMADSIRGLYRAQPDYVGPTVYVP